MNREYELVRRVLAGDAEAEELFVMTFRPRLIRACAHFLGREGTEAEEIVRETFLAAWPELKGRAIVGPVYAWLRGICLKKCHLRLRVRQELVLRLEEQVEALFQRRALQCLQGSEIEAYERRKMGLRRELMMRLSPDSRQVIDVRGQPMKFARISHALGLPLGTVLSRLDTALNEARLLLEREPEDLSHQNGGI